jgi:hypothetical protein
MSERLILRMSAIAYCWDPTEPSRALQARRTCALQDLRVRPK